jgi:hypothetical protein
MGGLICQHLAPSHPYVLGNLRVPTPPLGAYSCEYIFMEVLHHETF